jgi:transcriptional regulator with XRE-family HTH domain
MTPKELKARREAAGMSRIELAAAIGVSSRQIYRYENGETPILLYMAMALERALREGIGNQTATKPRKRSSKVA